MGNALYWIAGAVLFGLISAGFYTWMSTRKSGKTGLFLRSALVYTVIGLAIVWIMFIVAKE
ncbi:MAG: hypothetical protein K2O30_03560 [Duncaniella sp.]|nr:hypothetical protein [Duncaniella sp.]MDE7145210.1 hypothetical protein [Duncaniella sp.]